jgi:hypothetical protein
MRAHRWGLPCEIGGSRPGRCGYEPGNVAVLTNLRPPTRLTTRGCADERDRHGGTAVEARTDCWISRGKRKPCDRARRSGALLGAGRVVESVRRSGERFTAVGWARPSWAERLDKERGPTCVGYLGPSSVSCARLVICLKLRFGHEVRVRRGGCRGASTRWSGAVGFARTARSCLGPCRRWRSPQMRSVTRACRRRESGCAPGISAPRNHTATPVRSTLATSFHKSQCGGGPGWQRRSSSRS